MKNFSYIGRVLAAAFLSVAIVSCDGVKYPHTENHVSYKCGSVEFSRDWTFNGGFRSFLHDSKSPNDIVVDGDKLEVRVGDFIDTDLPVGLYPESMSFTVTFPRDVSELSVGDEFGLKPSSAALERFSIWSTDSHINVDRNKSKIVDGSVKVIDIDRKTVQGITSIVYFNFSFDFVISSEITFMDSADGETRTEQREFHLTEGRISSILNRW